MLALLLVGVDFAAEGVIEFTFHPLPNPEAVTSGGENRGSSREPKRLGAPTGGREANSRRAAPEDPVEDRHPYLRVAVLTI